MGLHVQCGAAVYVQMFVREAIFVIEPWTAMCSAHEELNVH